MKISRLYIRNFITVMAIIIAAQISIAALFRVVGRTAGSKNFHSDIAGLGYMINETIAEKQKHKQDDRESLEKFFKELAGIWSGNIWFEDKNGKIIAASSNTPRPDFPHNMAEIVSSGQFRQYRNHGGPPLIYLKVEFPDGGTVYVKKNPREAPIDEFYFTTGLLVITVIIALILFPVSRRITNPLKKLTESANAISRGEFHLRVDETATDEIGELARAFNRMSGRVLQMINGTKELTANISHQIRSPLARISVASGILRDKIALGDTSGIEKNISFIENEISEIDSLTGRIIELLRVETSYKAADLEKIDLQKVTEELSGKYTAIFSRKEISFNSEITSIPCIINGINRDILELFDILFDNAVKYTPNKGFLNIEMHPEKGVIVVNISNNSTHPPDFNTGRIFEPFTRMAKDDIPGNGLGLAIANRVVKNHGGEISADYTNGVFTVKLKFPAG